MWLSNADQGRKPWGLRAQIRSISQDAREHEAELANYRHLSMVEHGNPLGGIASFPVELSTEGIVLRIDPEDKVNVNLCITYLFAVSSCLHLAFYAATRLLLAAGAEVDRATADIDEAMEAVNEAHETHVKHMIEPWLSPRCARDT